MFNKEKIKKSYYYTGIEPTLDRLNSIYKTVLNFEVEGASRLTCALNMKHIDCQEVERLTEYISDARVKMEKELVRVTKLETEFNSDFATDYNDYYNSVSEILKRIRSHMSPLKYIYMRFCSPNHANTHEMHVHNIPSHSVFDESILGGGIYQKDMFDLKDYPEEVQGLYNEMHWFFNAEAECLAICMKLLKEEQEIRKDPNLSKYLLNKYREKAFKKLKNQIFLISDDVIENLKSICPAYQKYNDYASEEGFAQGEFHKHNVADMDHFCLIELMTPDSSLTTNERIYWKDNPLLVKKIKYVIQHFDEILPKDFAHKQMGYYEYIFCMWALPNNIKFATEYFIEHYTGKYKVTKYAGVSKNSIKYDRDSKDVKDFISNINKLLSESNQPDLMNQSA